MIRRPPGAPRTGNLCPYTPLFRAGDLGVAAGVAHDHHLAVVDLAAVDDAGVLRGPRAAPAASLDLQLLALVGQLEEASRAREEAPAEVGPQPEPVHVGVDLVDPPGQLLGPGVSVQLCPRAHRVTEASVLVAVARGPPVDNEAPPA